MKEVALTFDENTRTASVGSRDWLEASKVYEQIRGHLLLEGTVNAIVLSLEESTQFVATGHEFPALTSKEYESAQLTEELDEVYDGEMEVEEKELMRDVREYHRRRLSAG